MTLRGRQFDRALLRRVGRPATWEKGMLCPNIGDDGRHPYACPYCSGSRGYQYLDSTTLQCLFTSDSRKTPFDLAGAWEQGEATGTIAANYEVHDQDRIVAQDDPVSYNLTLERGSGASDTLRTPHVEQLVFVRGLDATYTIGTDCKVELDATSGDYKITWLGVTKPTAGDKYSVRLRVKPVWVVQGSPMVRAFGPGKRNQLLLRVKLQRFDRVVPRDE